MTLPRVVFDCVVLLQGAGRPSGPAGARVILLDRFTLCASPQIFSEICDVLSRPEIRRRFPLLTDERVEKFLKDIQTKAMVFNEVPKVFSYARDPDDEPYINLAVVAGARHLVTWDKDLLDLMKDELFKKRFPELTILDPVTFLKGLVAVTPNE